MIDLELDEEAGIAIVRPEGRLEVSDFAEIGRQIDPFIENNGKLSGLVIETQAFPGWENFSALLSHLKFVREHHRQVKKVAFVSSSEMLSLLPSIAGHFVSAEVKHFGDDELEPAKEWIRHE